MASQSSANDPEQRRLHTLDIRERCRLLQLTLGELGGAPRVQKAGVPYPVVDEAAYRPQLAHLQNLLGSMEFSPALHEFLKTRTIALADIVRKNQPARSLRAAWVKTNGERPADLKNFVTLQSQVFSGPESIQFIPSTVNVKKFDWNIRGSFNINAAGDDMMRPRGVSANLEKIAGFVVPQIVLNENLLGRDTVQGAYQSAFHEQIHSMLWQLGLAAHHGTIATTHPLYGDAVLMRERMKYGVEYTPHYIPAGYSADPLENICLTSEKLFVERCGAAQGSGLSGAARKLWNSLFSPAP